MNFKYLFLLLSIIICSNNLFSEINFKHDLPLDQVIKLAKQENKKIFIDVYATWCGPCKMMSNTTFKDEKVGAFMNENFINVKINGETEVGKGYGSKFGVRAFPTLIFLDSDGQLIRKEAGAYKTKQFIPFVEMVLDPSKDPINKFKEKFEQGKISQSEKVEYAQMLVERGLDYSALVKSYWDYDKQEIDTKNEDDMVMFYLEPSELSNDHVKTMTKNPELFYAGMGQFYTEKVKEVIFSTIENTTPQNLKTNKEDVEQFLRTTLQPIKKENPEMNIDQFVAEVNALFNQALNQQKEQTIEK